MRRTLFSALAILAGGVTFCAEAQTWHSLGPAGGNVRLVHGLSGGSGRAFAVASNGLFLSSDGGRTWREHAQKDLVGPFATWGPNPAINFAFDRQGRLLRSADWGDNWQPTGYVTSDDVIMSIAAVQSGVVYSSALHGTVRSKDDGATFAPSTGLPVGIYLKKIYNDANVSQLAAAGSDGNLYRSNDQGATWTVLYAPTPIDTVWDVVELSADHIVASIGGRVVVSTNGGATWTERLAPPRARLVRATPNGTRVLATNGTSCSVSFDGFATDYIADCSGSLPASPYASRTFSSVTSVFNWGFGGTRILANDGFAGVVALNDGEYSWSPSNADLHATSTRGLLLSPTDPDKLWTGRFPTGGYGGALLSTADGGATWRRQLDDGARYMRTFALDETTAADPATTRIYAAGWAQLLPQGRTDSGIWHSDDGGENWTALNEGLPTFDNGSTSGTQLSGTRKLALDPRSCANPPATGPCRQGPLNTLYAITDGSGSDSRYSVIKRTGNGPWSTATGALVFGSTDSSGYEGMNAVDLEVEPSTSTLYLSVFGSAFDNDGNPRVPHLETGVFRSTDGGTSWTHASSGLPLYTGSATTTKDVFALALHPRRPGTLWASTIEAGETASRINRSTDSGDHWTTLGAPLTGCDVRDLQVDSAAPDVLYAAGIAAGGTGCVWRSEDAGVTWTPLHGTLPAYEVYDVRQDPRDRRRLVVASDHGVWDVVAPSDKIFTDTGN